MKTKTCTKCKETKPVSEFYKRRRAKDGLTSQCRKCDSEQGRRYYEANKEKIAEYGRRYREANKEKIKERGRRYREANKDKIVEKDRRYGEANRKQRTRQSIKRSKATNARSLEVAYQQGLPWEDWEDEFVMADNGLTDYQKAVKLGRSRNSITSRKQKLRKKARNELTHDTVRV